MSVHELDHVTLGVRHLYASAHRLREETGLDSYEGGWLRAVPVANRVVPLPGDVFVNLESVIDHDAPLPGPAALHRRWYEESTREDGERWMNWCLRVPTYADLEDVAARFNAGVTDGEGRIWPNGFVGRHVLAPNAFQHTWGRGLPNWYFYPDLSVHSARRAAVAHRADPTGVAWLEVGGEPDVLEAHVGAETFAALPLRFVDRPTGLYGVGIATASGTEIAIRRSAGAPVFERLLRDAEPA